jgi:hypothetical protein
MSRAITGSTSKRDARARARSATGSTSATSSVCADVNTASA